LTLALSSGAEGVGPWRFYYESRESHQASTYLDICLKSSLPEGAAEKIQNIFGAFPYWSNSVLGQFVNLTDNSTHLPFDAHEMVSLIAPVSERWS